MEKKQLKNTKLPLPKQNIGQEKKKYYETIDISVSVQDG